MAEPNPLAPYGTSLTDVLPRYLSAAPVRTIVDIGAHEGQSLDQFAALFPDAAILSFEPVPATFERLRETARRHPRARAFNLALADTPGPRTIRCGRHSVLNSLLAPDAEYAWPTSPLDTQVTVDCDTLDAVATRQGLTVIDLLKIDVQGAESLVLAGARHLLAAGRIRAIKIEVLFLALYEGQPSFATLLAAMETHGFRFAGLYDEFHDAGGWLCWGDALFIHASARAGVSLPALP